MTIKEELKDEELTKHCNQLISKYLLHNNFIPHGHGGKQVVKMFEDFAVSTNPRCKTVVDKRRSQKKVAFTAQKVAEGKYTIYKGDKM